MLTDRLLEQAQALAPRIVALRRAIHAEPELGLETPLTLAKVRAELAGLPLEWREGTSCTGAVATLRGAMPGPGVLLRGDMDALPMPEDTGLDVASAIPGRMHACGHDTHTAMLAGAARILAERRSHGLPIGGDSTPLRVLLTCRRVPDTGVMAVQRQAKLFGRGTPLRERIGL